MICCIMLCEKETGHIISEKFELRRRLFGWHSEIKILFAVQGDVVCSG